MTENTLAIGPTGRLRLIHDAEAGATDFPEPLLHQLRESLAESTAAGLVALADASWPAELPATLAFWRSWVRLFFRMACHAESEPGAAWRTLPPPSDDDLAALVASAPPMVGLEFVTAPA